jgi:hypothetical protein
MLRPPNIWAETPKRLRNGCDLTDEVGTLSMASLPPEKLIHPSANALSSIPCYGIAYNHLSRLCTFQYLLVHPRNQSTRDSPRPLLPLLAKVLLKHRILVVHALHQPSNKPDEHRYTCTPQHVHHPGFNVRVREQRRESHEQQVRAKNAKQ